MKLWSAHNHVYELTRAQLHSPSHGPQHRTAQRVVVQVRVVEQGKAESYCSPKHGEQKPHRENSVEARSLGAAGVGGLAMCHDVPHGRHYPRAAAF